ncbi:MAG: hypothetical protein FWF91_07735 [Coriobacteriia bacterium]|nr:hypothetical protein [Coriobacteriia bacterium]
MLKKRNPQACIILSQDSIGAFWNGETIGRKLSCCGSLLAFYGEIITSDQRREGGVK